jgi:7,8-dihydroneopterin aldolase/epimerase/oxygenase
MSALLDPRLADCRRIFVRNFELEVSIGFYQAEREKRQRVLLDIDVYVPLDLTTPRYDQANEVIDYDFIRRAVVDLTATRHFNLQETLLEHVVRACLAKSGVRAVRAVTQKPDIYPGAMTVGIEVFRFRDSASE